MAVQQGAASEDPKAYPRRYIEALNDARMKFGKRCVLAHLDWAGEKGGFFSILPARTQPMVLAASAVRAGIPSLPNSLP